MSPPRRSRPTVADYVVVGAGAAGATLAGRLSGSSSATVAVLEAGDHRGHGPGRVMPRVSPSVTDWGYATTKQEILGGRRISWPRGKMPGGSASTDAMMWVRGFAADYDEWADAAGDTWSYASLLPCFRRIERVGGSDDPDHGTDGALHVEPGGLSPHTHQFLQVAEELGYPIEPANTAEPAGFSEAMVSRHLGRGLSPVHAYLKPARGRPNVRVLPSCHATRVIVEGGMAVGVEYASAGARHRITARRAVILCGGVVNTPQLLMLSGIGHDEHLLANGIEPLLDRPAVGRHLRDHLAAVVTAESAHGSRPGPPMPSRGPRSWPRRALPAPASQVEAYGFVRSGPGIDLPDLEMVFGPRGFLGEARREPDGDAVSVGSVLLKPRSEGTVRLGSSDPLALARVDPRYLTDSDGADLAALSRGVELCDDFLEGLRERGVVTGALMQPRAADDEAPEERRERTLRSFAQSFNDPVGTARMGADADAVVDPQLRVRGIGGLRVADASVMPTIVRGHTAAATMVIAERCADLLAADV